MSVAPNRPIDASTRLCAVYGHPIRHSASPAMHNAALATLDLNWCYLACDVHPDHLHTAIRGAAAMGFIGLNLTVPHKILALDLVDLVDSQARAWGAVNTLVFESQDPSGQWIPLGQLPDHTHGPVRVHGHNTDADALLRALDEDLGFVPSPISRILILGMGGAGRVAALRLAQAGAGHLHLVNRTQDRAETVAAEIRAMAPGCDVLTAYPDGPVDLLINATSAGLKPQDPLPLDPQRFPVGNARAVYDMIYKPVNTPLLVQAQAAGCRAANGLGMLLHQGARALELWTGRPAPLDVMREALRRHLYA